MATELAKSPEKFYYGKVWLDSKGKIVIQVNREGRVTKDTKVAMGIFDEKKKWMPGEAIEGGIGADLFKDKGKVLRVRVTVEADGGTITRIFVTNTDERLERASGEFDPIHKRHGAFTNGSGPVSYVRVELDDKGRVIKLLPPHDKPRDQGHNGRHGQVQRQSEQVGNRRRHSGRRVRRHLQGPHKNRTQE